MYTIEKIMTVNCFNVILSYLQVISIKNAYHLFSLVFQIILHISADENVYFLFMYNCCLQIYVINET